MALKVVGDKKKKQAVEESEAEVIEAEVVSAPKLKKVKEAPVGKLIETARQSYRAFHVSWYDFAKNMKQIKDNAEWEKSGHADLASLCREEFSGIPYATIVKFIKVVEDFGAVIESRLAKGALSLPSYDAMYEIHTHESRLPKEESAKLRKLVVDGKISLRELRETIKNFVLKAPSKHAEGRRVKKDKRQEELADELAVDKDVESITSDVDVDEDEEMTSSIDKSAIVLIKLVKGITSQISSLASTVKVSSDHIVELAQVIDEAVIEMNEFLNKVEEIESKED